MGRGVREAVIMRAMTELRGEMKAAQPVWRPRADKPWIHLPIVRITIAESLGKRVACNLQLRYLQKAKKKETRKYAQVNFAYHQSPSDEAHT